MESKICAQCEKILPIIMYDVNKHGNKQYYRNKCKTCRLNDKHVLIENKKQKVKEVIIIKQCNKCNIVKECTEFSRKSVSNDGYNSCCKDCYNKTRCKNKPQRKNEAIYDTTLKEKLCILCNITKDIVLFKPTKKSKDGYYHKCNDCWKPCEWNSDKQRQAHRKYVETHREKVREKYKRQSLNINRRVRHSLNCRISQLLKQHSLAKNNRTMQYVGCDFHFLKNWFEFQFKDGMSWDNYGEWEIDHIIPCSSFDLEKKDEQHSCFNWINLSPCWKIDNIKKGNKIIDSIIENHKNKVDTFLSINPLPNLPSNRVDGTK